MSAALAPHTYLPSDADSDEIAEVRSFLAAHARRGTDVEPRYLLVGSAEGEQVELPRPIYEALLLVAESLASGKGVTVAPESQQLTTQQAADLLGVSRPTVVRLADAGSLPSERFGNRRRIRLGDLLAYREQRRSDQYEMLATTAIELDEEDDIELAQERLRVARHAVAARRRAAAKPPTG
ncbi:helix-turn-helix domain-containing protein [Cellulomonas sp. S1-8]|uniref:helix-turn-helix domain-containing protein n=1 Tax=Cellulomonas sp. S1-8 TaxID=2904790 RepID=UPI002242D389|nr:helix-turn-helix domain-containing protein [Cellulomonas sp. S1-8]UZN02693.1 helix-turn-helix domain-containing protein [Cellulomonas sp. S1-8]